MANDLTTALTADNAFLALYKRKGEKAVDLEYNPPLSKRGTYKGEHPVIYNAKKVLHVEQVSKVLEKLRENEILKDFPWGNVLLAGGYICGLLTGYESKDMDIFVYGIADTRALDAKVNEIIAHVEKKCPDVTILRTQYTIKIMCEPYIEIILRAYSTASEVLHSFDVGSSAVGYNGHGLMFTSMAKFAYEYGCNVVNVEKASISYDWRLVKYFYRGFGIIFPNLKVDRVRSNFSRVQIHDMTFKIRTESNQGKVLSACFAKTPEPRQYYSSHHQIGKILANFAKATGEKDDPLYTELVQISPEDMDKEIEKLREAIVLPDCEHLVEEYRNKFGALAEAAVNKAEKGRINWRMGTMDGLVEFFPLRINEYSFYYTQSPKKETPVTKNVNNNATQAPKKAIAAVKKNTVQPIRDREYEDFEDLCEDDL